VLLSLHRFTFITCKSRKVHEKNVSQDFTCELFWFLSKFFLPKFELPNSWSGCGLFASAAYLPVVTVTKSCTVIGYPSRQDGTILPLTTENCSFSQIMIPMFTNSLFNQDGWVLALFILCLWTLTPFWSMNMQRKNLAYPVTLTSHLVNNPYVIGLDEAQFRV